ncbi:retrovirus-related pol polyprotein from transposon TNT 1-94 [Tanacetum coccineum]
MPRWRFTVLTLQCLSHTVVPVRDSAAVSEKQQSRLLRNRLLRTELILNQKRNHGEVIDEQELESHITATWKIYRRFPNEDSGNDSDAIGIWYNTILTINLFANDIQPFGPIESIVTHVQWKRMIRMSLMTHRICVLMIDSGWTKKSVDTKFDKPSVVRQPNAQRIPKPSVLGKPAPFLDSLERKYFAKKKSVLKTNESEGLSKPVTPQNLPQTAKACCKKTQMDATKHMTRHFISAVPNFVERILEVSVRFAMIQFAPILGPWRILVSSGTRLTNGNRGTVSLYNFSSRNTSSSPICLMAKASPSQAWLWHRRLSHLNFDYINLLSKKDVVIGLPKLKSIIIQLMRKKAYHIINDRKPSIKHLHIFGCTCYLTRDGENLDKMKEKGDSCILVGYSTQSKGYRVYNKRTRLIVESIHLRFDEIKEMSETSVANDTSGLVPQRQKASDYDNPDPAPELQNVSPSADTTVPSQQELDLLFGPLYDEFFNDGAYRVNKSSSPTDNSVPQDTHPSTNIQPTSEPSTPTNTHAEENTDDQAEFTNPFCTPVQEIAESSSRNIGNSNVHTFNQPRDSEYRWTKDHPLTQVRGNPSKPVQTRRQLATDCNRILKIYVRNSTKSTSEYVEPKNIKEQWLDSAWIEQCKDELHILTDYNVGEPR